MKLKEYMEYLDKLVNNNPSLLEATVVYAKDDEGNGYYEVHYEPSTGSFDGEDFDPSGESGSPIVVCLN